MEFYKLHVSKIIRETPGAVSIEFDKTDTPDNFFDFIPGQHLTLKMVSNGKEQRRSYSLSSVPEDKSLRITVKKVKGGLISNHLFQNLKEGDVIEVSKPEGHFCIKPESEHKRAYYFFAAGSGITPVYSMIQALLEHEPRSTVHLLYGNRKEEDIIFYNGLNDLYKKHEGQFFLQYTLSQHKKSILPFLSSKKDDWQGWTGRISKKQIELFLNQNQSSEKEKSYYLCGPGEMIEEVKKYLLGHDIDLKSIHAEYFSSPVSPATDSSKSKPSPEFATIVVKLNGQTQELKISGKDKILDSLQAAKLDPPYSCCSGACSTCMAKLISGEVKMDSALALEPDEIAAGYILTCQARPVSEHIEVHY